MITLTTRIFKNGDNQAVRIPQEFRFDATEIEISRNANGDLMKHPIPIDRGAALLATLNAFDDDLISQLEANQNQQAPMQDREAL